MEEHKYKHSVELNILLSKFPRWIYVVYICIVLFIFFTVYFMSNNITYTENIYYDVNILSVNSKEIKCKLILPCDKSVQFTKREITLYNSLSNNNIEGTITHIGRADNNYREIFITIPINALVAYNQLNTKSSILSAKLPSKEISFLKKLCKKLNIFQ